MIVTPRFGRLQSAFTNPMIEVYLLFYEAVLQTFVHFNKITEGRSIDTSEQMDSFLKKLASKFVPVEDS